MYYSLNAYIKLDNMNALSPWHSLYSFAPPPFPFCGKIVDGFIADPADTYTSFFYLIIGLLIYLKSKYYNQSIQNKFYIIPIIITIGSILFHMSFTFVLLMADFIGIFILSFYCIGMNLLRLKKIKCNRFYTRIYCAGFLYTFLMVLNYNIFHSGLLMIPLLSYAAYLEFKCFKANANINYKYFIISVSSASTGYLFMLLEGKPFHIGCFGTPYYFHSIWHAMSAICFYYLYLFYDQFNLKYK
jgi:hypothetical protein